MVRRHRIVRVATGEVPDAFALGWIQRVVRRKRSEVCRQQGIGPVEDTHEFVRARLPIEHELQAFVEEDVGIARVEHASAAILGGAVEAAQQLAFAAPHGDATREVVGLGDPQPPLAVDGNPVRVVQVLRLVAPDAGDSSDADAAHGFSIRREDFDLMRAASIRDVNEPLREVARVFETGDQCLAVRLAHRVKPQQARPAEHKHGPLGLEGNAARIRHRQTPGDFSVTSIHEQQFVLPDHRAHQHAIMHGERGEHEHALAPVKAFEHGWQGCVAFLSLLLFRFVAELRLEDRFVFHLARLRRETQFAFPHGTHVTSMVRDGFGAVVHRERWRAGPDAADPALAAELRAVLVQPLQAVAAFRNESAHDDKRLAILATRARHRHHAGRRRVIGHPTAGVVGGRPRGLAGAVDAELVAQFQRIMHEPAHAILPRRHHARRNVIQPVLRSLGVAQQIIAAIPPRNVLARGERRFADQVSHATALRVFNHQRDLPGPVEFELHRDRRRLLGLFG